MMLSTLRGAYGRALTPLARFLLRLGLSPGAVTVTGTLGVSIGSLALLPTKHLLIGAGVIAFFLLGDGLDGTMARLSGGESRFGAFLDSTLDRVADAALFSGLVLWAAGTPWIQAVSLAALALGFLVSYARARAEAEGWPAGQGPCERTERLALTLAGLVAVGLGAPDAVLGVVLAAVALGSTVTVARRIASARRASREPRERHDPLA